jgi:hypothetical protein
LLLFAENDDPLAGIIVVGVVVIVVTVIIVLSRRHERHRKESLAEIARANDLELGADEDGVHRAHVEGFKLGNVGRSRRLNNVISGAWAGEDLMICDYRYTTGHGKNSRRHSQSILFLSLNRPCPDLIMGPEGVFSKVAQAFGAKDIDFLTHPEFSKSFVLRGEDEDAIRERFDFDLLEFFERWSGVSLEVSRGELAYYRNNKRCKPELLEAFIEEGLALKAAFDGKLPN